MFIFIHMYTYVGGGERVVCLYVSRVYVTQERDRCVRTYVCMIYNICLYIYVHIYIYTCVYIYIYTLHIYIYIYVCVCIYVDMYIYIHV